MRVWVATWYAYMYIEQYMNVLMGTTWHSPRFQELAHHPDPTAMNHNTVCHAERFNFPSSIQQPPFCNRHDCLVDIVVNIGQGTFHQER